MHPVAAGSIGEQVPLALVVHQAVRVVEPSLFATMGGLRTDHRVELMDGPLSGSEVKLRPEGFLVQGDPGR